MHTSKTLTLLLITLSFSIAFSGVNAQATSISNLNYPALLAQDTHDPISVTVTVSYKDAGPGYTLVVGILDMDRSTSGFVSGLAIGSPDACVNQPVLSAWCVSRTSSTSGVESLEFRIGGILGERRDAGNWNLNMTAALYDANNALVTSSASSVQFAIMVGPIILTVTVPEKAAVWVDGVEQKAGSAKIAVKMGTHNVTVPSIVEVDEGTRLRFDHWTDSATTPSRTVTVDLSQELEAVYVTQYRLSVTDATPSVAGGGWYDSGYTATFSVAETDQMTGILGVLGGSLKFQGWYENNTLLSDSPVDHIIMNKPHTLSVLWQPNYTNPLIILGLLAAIGSVPAYVAITRRTTTAALKAPRPPRKAGKSIRTRRKASRRSQSRAV